MAARNSAAIAIIASTRKLSISDKLSIVPVFTAIATRFETCFNCNITLSSNADKKIKTTKNPAKFYVYANHLDPTPPPPLAGGGGERRTPRWRECLNTVNKRIFLAEAQANARAITAIAATATTLAVVSATSGHTINL